MKKHFKMIVLAAVVVAALLLSTVAFTVNEFKDIVLVKTFGATSEKDVYSGSDKSGLRFKVIYPIQSTEKYDSRTFVFDDTSQQIETKDKQNLLVQVFCAWRIADPIRFTSSITSPPAAKTAEAEARLRTIVHSAKQSIATEHTMEQFVNTNPDRMMLTQIEQRILETVGSQAMRDYGIEIRMIGIKSLGLPKGVTDTVIKTMIEERQKYVQKYQSAGEAQANAIRARANAASEMILAFANAKAQEIKSEGDSAAARYYSEFNRNPQLSAFLRSLESLKKELQTKTVIVLDSNVLPAVKFFHEGPSVGDTTTPPAVVTDEKVQP